MAPPEMGIDDRRTLGDVGEGAALRAILPLLPTAGLATLGPGDDSAVLTVPDGRVVISCDMMIEGPDFAKDWSSMSDVGFKAIASNAADIAAMGAVVTGYEIAVAAPAATTVGELKELARGFAEGIAALTPGAGVLGGDLSHSPVLAIAVTVLGDLQGRPPVTRSGARPGDILALAGERGLSHRGLSLLRESADAVKALRGGNSSVEHHLRPIPPIALGPVAARAGATAMMDVSDGLVLDATRMARASGVQMKLDPTLEWDEASLYGGEDHGLLACFPADVDLPAGFSAIGLVLQAQGADLVSLVGVDLHSSLGGWDPFGDHVAV